VGFRDGSGDALMAESVHPERLDGTTRFPKENVR
jgi:hypothetical protein